MALEYPTGDEGDEPTLRADAERNRLRLVESAQAAFAERGLEAPLDEIARRAGVGIATLYRRFPTREDLIAASFAPKLAAYAAAAERALGEADAWTGLCLYAEEVCAMQAADLGLNAVLSGAVITVRSLQRQRERTYRDIAELIRRAQAQGTLRPDATPEDFALLLMANAGVVQATRRNAPEAWRRFVALALDGFRADHARPLPDPISPAAIYRSMLGIERPRR